MSEDFHGGQEIDPQPTPKPALGFTRQERRIDCLTGRKFYVRDMTMREQMLVDRQIPDANQNSMMYYRIAGTIMSIDDVPLEKVNSIEDLDKLMDTISATEFQTLLADYIRYSGLNTVKN